MPVIGGGANRHTGGIVRYGGVQQPPLPSGGSFRSNPLNPFAPALPTNAIIDGYAGVTSEHQGGGVFLLTKVGSVSAFDSGAVSGIGATGDFILRATSLVSSGLNIMIGVNSDPLTTSEDSSIDYALYFSGNNDMSGRESGGIVGLGGVPYDPSTPFWIVREGTTLTYRKGTDVATATVLRTVNDVSSTLYFDSSFYTPGGQMLVQFDVQLPAAVAYSMAADGATFSYSGQDIGLKLGVPLTAGLGTFSYTGQSANLLRGLPMAAGLATYSYAGQPATGNYPLTAGLGTFSYTGQPVGMARGYAAAGALGSFTYSGQAVNLIVSRLLAAGLGTFSYSGQAASLFPGVIMAAGAGTFAYTGQSASPALRMPADAAAYALAGQSVAMTVSSGASLITLVMPVTVGGFAYAGQAVAMSVYRLWTASEVSAPGYTVSEPAAATWTRIDRPTPAFTPAGVGAGTWTEVPESGGSWGP